MEYESRRDADDAYHEMHNKRIGRDDLLKIEVRILKLFHLHDNANCISTSGLVHHLRQAGASMQAVRHAVVSALLVAALALRHHARAATTMTGTETAHVRTETAIGTVENAAIAARGIALVAQMTVTVI